MLPDPLLLRLLGDDVEGAVDTLALVGDKGAQIALLDRPWRQPSDTTEVVLEVLEQQHPDKQTAKAARKASFRRRSSTWSFGPVRPVDHPGNGNDGLTTEPDRSVDVVAVPAAPPADLAAHAERRADRALTVALVLVRRAHAAAPLAPMG